MPRYLLSVYGPTLADADAFNETLRRDGHVVFADDLEPATTATTVDGRGDEPAFTDGPCLEANECLGRFWVVEASDLDAALTLATEGSKACRGKVEVRPFRTGESVQTLLEP